MSKLTPMIAISGDLGSGKSTVAKLVASLLGWDVVSTGDIHRSIASQRNLSTLELNHIAETDTRIDQTVDSELERLSEFGANLVVDSRMAWWFIPQALSVHLTVRPDVGDARVLQRKGDITEVYTSRASAQVERKRRAESERERFSALYGVDIQRLRNYALIIDATSASPDQVAATIAAEWRHPSSDREPRLFVSPSAIFPTEQIQVLRGVVAASVSTLGAERHLSAHPIEVAYSYPFFSAIDGHKRLSSAILSGRQLVPARLVGEGDEELQPGLTATENFARSFSRSRLYDWEDVHKIDYGLAALDGLLPAGT